MNEAAEANKSIFGSPRETFREIITKAVCGKAQKSLKCIEFIDPPQGVVPNQILGCSVTELRLNEPEVKDASNNAITIVAGGIFEIHIWYAFNNEKETDVLRRTVKFAENLPFDNYDCQNTGSLDVKITVDKSPVVIDSAIIEDNRIKLDIEMDISAEVIGETKLFIQVHTPEYYSDCDDHDEDEE
ncbi:outer spore coat protein CotE [Desulfoscipio geothermicus]|uniref:Spore coat protein E n=1 Tax=Desulfoscipio geothermicus DSM 3669 TaxID=1121426 RepID=A0A1I6DU22_9FIRM|nr:outer spore coat protein CotE [Desulfoscipio geothermicus]SFR08808.1 spore coat protein E [Desulfoscipio geothermicus DSM 3669]